MKEQLTSDEIVLGAHYAVATIGALDEEAESPGLGAADLDRISQRRVRLEGKLGEYVEQAAVLVDQGVDVPPVEGVAEIIGQSETAPDVVVA